MFGILLSRQAFAIDARRLYAERLCASRVAESITVAVCPVRAVIAINACE
jgi:hypothetical protein